jgi:restriction system protein
MSADSAPKLSFADAAQKILEEAGTPLHYVEIAKRAVKQGLIVSDGLTPENSMYTAMYLEITKSEKQGTTPRFSRAKGGIFSFIQKLSPTQKTVQETNNKAIDDLVAKLKAMKPDSFERLIGRLLIEMGLEQVQVVGGPKDGGIDVKGVLQIDDGIRVNLSVQVKRYAKSVPVDVVTSLRGSLDLTRGEQGLIVTTSKFTKDAVSESKATNKTPISLIDGEQLAGLLMKYRIGVQSHTVFEVSDTDLESDLFSPQNGE